MALKFVHTVLFLLFFFPAVAQQQLDVDSVFKKAQELAFAGKYKESRVVSRVVLSHAPEYTDASILIGRTYAWQQNYDSAGYYLHAAENENPTVDGYFALAQLKKWTEEFSLSLKYVEKGLEIDSSHIPLLLMHSKLLLINKKEEGALEVVKKVLLLDQEHTEALILLDQIKKRLRTNQLMLNYQITTFSQHGSERHILNMEYLKEAKNLKYIGRLSYADQGNSQSIQMELETYVPLNEKINLFLAGGFSNGNFFPLQRGGAEVFYSLPYGFEASIGTRALFFEEESLIMYTVQAGKYFKKNWFSIRGYTHNTNGNFQTTGIIQLRHYFSTSNEYLSLILSKGSVPFSPFGVMEVYQLNASSIGVNTQFALNDQIFLGGIFSYEYEEFNNESYQNRINAAIRLIAKF